LYLYNKYVITYKTKLNEAQINVKNINIILKIMTKTLKICKDNYSNNGYKTFTNYEWINLALISPDTSMKQNNESQKHISRHVLMFKNYIYSWINNG